MDKHGLRGAAAPPADLPQDLVISLLVTFMTKLLLYLRS
jgi:hypothetical protein